MRLTDGRAIDFTPKMTRNTLGGGANIDDDHILPTSTWSSRKINNELQDAANEVVIQETQPQEESAKVWIKESAEEEYLVPTYEEFQDLQHAVGYNELTWTLGKYYVSGNSVTNLKADTPNGTDGNMVCTFAECEEGDVFYVKSTGTSDARSWIFLSAYDMANNITNRETAAASQAGINKRIDIPAGVQFILFNARADQVYSVVRGEHIVDRVDELEQRADRAEVYMANVVQ